MRLQEISLAVSERPLPPTHTCVEVKALAASACAEPLRAVASMSRCTRRTPHPSDIRVHDEGQAQGATISSAPLSCYALM
jgi:hypothetical protein